MNEHISLFFDSSIENTAESIFLFKDRMQLNIAYFVKMKNMFIETEKQGIYNPHEINCIFKNI